MVRRVKDMEPTPLEGHFLMVLSMASEQLAKQVRIHGGYASFHEGYGVLLEEIDELWDEIKIHRSARRREKIRNEAVQVAACALEIAAIALMDRDEEGPDV